MNKIVKQILCIAVCLCIGSNNLTVLELVVQRVGEESIMILDLTDGDILEE